MDPLTLDDVLRFWSHVDRRGPDECWPWTASRYRDGYGQARLGGKGMNASRAAWRLARGDPGELHVLHSCDNPPCCNPDHLSLGTHADNMADKVRKGRARGGTGERNGNAKLTVWQASAIRTVMAAREATAADLARQYGVTRDTIYRVARGATWDAPIPWDVKPGYREKRRSPAAP